MKRHRGITGDNLRRHDSILPILEREGEEKEKEKEEGGGNLISLVKSKRNNSARNITKRIQVSKEKDLDDSVSGIYTKNLSLGMPYGIDTLDKEFVGNYNGKYNDDDEMQPQEWQDKLHMPISISKDSVPNLDIIHQLYLFSMGDKLANLFIPPNQQPPFQWPQGNTTNTDGLPSDTIKLMGVLPRTRFKQSKTHLVPTLVDNALTSIDLLVPIAGEAIEVMIRRFPLVRFRGTVTDVFYTGRRYGKSRNFHLTLSGVVCVNI